MDKGRDDEEEDELHGGEHELYSDELDGDELDGDDDAQDKNVVADDGQTIISVFYKHPGNTKGIKMDVRVSDEELDQLDALLKAVQCQIITAEHTKNFHTTKC